MQPILYGAPLSPFVRKVAVVLEEKAIAYDWKPVRPHDFTAPDFLAISPLGKIPAYKDDKASLADSSVISFYLEKIYPEHPLYPDDTIALARALWFEEYVDGAMVTPMSDIYFHKFFNPLIGKPADQNVLKDAIENRLPPMLAYLESQLKSAQWLVEDRFSIADITVAGSFLNLHMANYFIDEKAYPRLTAHIRNSYERPSFTKCNKSARDFLNSVKEKVRLAAQQH